MTSRTIQQGNGSVQVVQLVEGKYQVPYPYEVWGDGVYLCAAKATSSNGQADETCALPEALTPNRKRVLFRPLWIAGKGYTVDTEEPLLQLRFVDVTGVLKDVWVARGQITDQRALVTLGASGLPIDTQNAEGALMYLRTMEAANLLNPTMPMRQVGHRSGPYLVEGKLGWLIGKQWIGAGHLESDPRTNTKYTAAFQPHGDEQAWLDKWREIREAGWVARFMMGATFAPALLRLLKCRTFIVHQWGQSGCGKTAIAVFALSAHGNPEILYSTLNRTTISITEIFRHLTDLPVLFDELQVTSVAPSDIIYAICTGAGRERGAKDGGLRQDRQQWLTVARTTGEAPLITDADLGGQFNRILQINSPSFTDAQQAQSVYPFTTENYGYAGPEFLRHLSALLNVPKSDLYPNGGLGVLQKLNAELRAALISRIGIDSNHAQYAAVIATAQTLSESWLLGIPAAEAKERALDDATLALKETAPKKQASYAEKALSKLRDHWISNKGNYVDDTSEHGRAHEKWVRQMIGVETTYGLVFIPHEANALLIAAGYEPARVWRDFDANGWLWNADDGNPMRAWMLRNGKSKDHPCYVVRGDIFYTDSVRQTKLQLINGGLSNIGGLES